jgi:DNA-binding response OmpR family regulator
MRVLIVEDDAVLSDVIADTLVQAGHRVDTAATVAATGHLWRVQAFDAVLLDLNLPDGSALAALRAARARGDRTPVLVLSARNRTDERIAGLDAGADDYLGKPFELAEILARLRALERRALGGDERCEVAGLRFDRRAGRFHVRREGADAPLELPAREHEVLAELMTPPGRVVSKRTLAEKLSPLGEWLGDNALEAFVSRLRRKLAGSGAGIRTLRGLGYLVEPQDAAEPPP